MILLFQVNIDLILFELSGSSYCRGSETLTNGIAFRLWSGDMLYICKLNYKLIGKSIRKCNSHACELEGIAPICRKGK
jgi:hypothetical protein